MDKISINIGLDCKGFFALKKGNKILGQIHFNLMDNELILLKTLIHVKRSLHSIGCRLLQEVVEYARMHELKIITLSKFVQRQFSQNLDLYADVWEKA
jgi:hypothetical protein